MTKRLIAPLLCLALAAGATLAPAVAAHAEMPPPVALKNSEGLPSLAPVIKQITPAVVNISTRGVIKRRIQGPFMSPLFRQFFGVPENQTMEQPFESLGSGIIVNAQKGYILTNYHVIRDAKQITVTLYDNRTFKAKVIGDDPLTDIAVVQIKAKNLTQIELGNSSNLEVGDYVIAIGNPLGLQHTATFGIVSALGRPNVGGTNDGQGGESGIGKYDDFIQTDAAINPGNSGGPLVNLRGQLVGVNTAIATTNGGNIGIGFAIPVDMAKAVMDQLIKYGKVERGELGVYIQNLTPELAKQFNLKPGQGGALVAQVKKGSAAAKAGLKQGDVITEVNGQNVRNPAMLSSYIAIQRVGTEIDLKVYRDGKPMTIKARIGKKENPETGSTSGSHQNEKLGATFGDIDKSSPLYGQVHGVVVTQVTPGEAADQAGLQPGDVIVAIAHRPVRDLSEFNQALSAYKGHTVLLTVRRGDQVFFTTLQIP
jgi:Do/DeqQ family serine protease